MWVIGVEIGGVKVTETIFPGYPPLRVQYVGDKGWNMGVKVTGIIFPGYPPVRVQCVGESGRNWGGGDGKYFSWIPPSDRSLCG